MTTNRISVVELFRPDDGPDDAIKLALMDFLLFAYQRRIVRWETSLGWAQHTLFDDSGDRKVISDRELKYLPPALLEHANAKVMTDVEQAYSRWHRG